MVPKAAPEMPSAPARDTCLSPEKTAEALGLLLCSHEGGPSFPHIPGGKTMIRTTVCQALWPGPAEGQMSLWTRGAGLSFAGEGRAVPCGVLSSNLAKCQCHPLL